MSNTKTQNLGQIGAIFIGSNPPTNTKLIWYDTNDKVHKVYNTNTGVWMRIISIQAVGNTTISNLHNMANSHELQPGAFYYLTDVGTLCIAITKTKIWYVDALNNYVVNDLVASQQYYINSDNLLIDGSTGVWNTQTGKLEFSFNNITSGTDLQSDNDYIVIRRNNGMVWNWIKAKLSGFVSAVSGNSISWNKGFYFNFVSAVNSVMNKIGGVVGYDKYNEDKDNFNHSISVLSELNNDILLAAKSYTDNKTNDESIYGKHLSQECTLLDNPPDIPGVGVSLKDIIDILVSWVNILQSANRIIIGNGFSANGRSGNINFSDSVKIAIEKLLYKINNQSSANGITMPSGFNENERDGNITANDLLNEVLEKLITITNKLKNAKNIKLPIDWSEGEYRGGVADNDDLATAIGKLSSIVGNLSIANGVKLSNQFDSTNFSKIVPSNNISVEEAIGRLTSLVKQLIDSSFSWDSAFKDEDWYASASLGDKIGEFDSDGNPLYTATLEGAVYLLALWYSKHFNNIYDYKEYWISATAMYFKYFNGNNPLRDYFNMSYKVTENNLVLSSQSLMYNVYYDSSECDRISTSHDSNSSCLFIQNMKAAVIELLGKKYGYQSLFELGVPITASDGDYNNGTGKTNTAIGKLYGCLVQSEQDSETDTWLKIIPIFTHAILGNTANYNDVGICMFNNGSKLGTNWLYNSQLFSNSQYLIINIPEFCINIPLY